VRKLLLFSFALGCCPVAQAAAPAAEMVAPAETKQGLQPADPLLLAKARPIAAILLPDGVMTELMGASMQKMMGPVMDSVSKMPIRDMLQAGGVDPAEVEKLNAATIGDIMAILDPAFDKRMSVMTETMFPALGRFMSQFEPDMREGMAEAFAGRYTATELDEISGFLATPAGAKFGSGFMLLATDPHYMSRMQAIMPKMMEAMPSIMRESSAALAELPKPRKYDELSKAERARLADLLGVDPKKMKQ